jgi:antitoxin MazE
MATVQRWGNSLAVRIPAPLAKQLHVQEGTAIEVSVDEGALVVRPRRRRYRLKDLLRNCKPAQLHGETDFGPDVGREVIE